jgi:pimeloyl-ACP methyl ester carboxylesterase
VLRHLRQLTAAAGLPRIRVHDLRHFAATTMLSSAVPLAMASKTMRHSTLSTTTEVYGHLPAGGREPGGSRRREVLSHSDVRGRSSRESLRRGRATPVERRTLAARAASSLGQTKTERTPTDLLLRQDNMMADTARPTIVLVHGAWHGPWCWDTLRVVLHTDAWKTTAPRLLSVADGARQRAAGLHDDVQALLDHVDHIDGPVVLVAHSYAGMPATEVAALRPGRIRRLIYLAAYLPHAEDSLYSIHGLPVPDDVTGTVAVPDDPIAMFYADVDPAVAAAAAARLKPQSLRSWTERIAHADVGATPTTYLVCTNDQALPTSMQEGFAARTEQVSRIASGHAPFLSQPQELAVRIERSVLPSDPSHPEPADVAASA